MRKNQKMTGGWGSPKGSPARHQTSLADKTSPTRPQTSFADRGSPGRGTNKLNTSDVVY